MCSNESPWAVTDDLAYGYAAVNIAGGSEASWCCACYELLVPPSSFLSFLKVLDLGEKDTTSWVVNDERGWDGMGIYIEGSADLGMIVRSRALPSQARR